jgi:hypothetical protein
VSLGRILSYFSCAACTHHGVEVEAKQSNFAQVRTEALKILTPNPFQRALHRYEMGRVQTGQFHIMG